MFRKFYLAVLPLAFCALYAAPAEATMVKKMALAEMCQVAGRIFRGTVVDIDKGSVEAGGGDIPTITYKIDVTEQFKGEYPQAENGTSIISFTIVDLPVIEVPALAVGQDYLLMTTKPSAVGLSTMVGLAQGTFRIYGGPNAEMAVNGLNNAGLADGIRGPLSYRDMATRIRAEL